MFIKWLQTAKQENRSSESIPLPDLDRLLALYILLIKQKGGKEYEPVSIKSKFASLSRWLREKGVNIELIRHAREVLSAKCRSLKADGKGNKNNRAEPFSPSDLKKLSETDQLGTSKSNSFSYSIK